MQTEHSRTYTDSNTINKELYKSIAQEFNSVKSRLELIIGTNTHLGENGSYRERLLIEVIRKNLPSSTRVCTGFIVKQEIDLNSTEQRFYSSSQQDILVLKPNSQVLFDYENVVVAPIESVLAKIEVKTSLIAPINIYSTDNRSLIQILKKMNDINFENTDIFNGLFVYNFNANRFHNSCNETEQIMDVLQEGSGINYFVALGDELFYRSITPESGQAFDLYYFSENLSFGYFISNLRAHVEKIINPAPYIHQYLFPYGGKDGNCICHRGE